MGVVIRMFPLTSFPICNKDKKSYYIKRLAKIEALLDDLRKRRGEMLYIRSLRDPKYSELLDKLVDNTLEEIGFLNKKIDKNLPPQARYRILINLLESLHLCFSLKSMGIDDEEVIEVYIPRILHSTCRDNKRKQDEDENEECMATFSTHLPHFTELHYRLFSHSVF